MIICDTQFCVENKKKKKEKTKLHPNTKFLHVFEMVRIKTQYMRPACFSRILVWNIACSNFLGLKYRLVQYFLILIFLPGQEELEFLLA